MLTLYLWMCIILQNMKKYKSKIPSFFYFIVLIVYNIASSELKNISFSALSPKCILLSNLV